MYRVIIGFIDLQDALHRYYAGDDYPREGYMPTADRIEMLSGKNNVQGAPLIEEIAVAPEDAVVPKDSVQLVRRSRKK